ncbi:MAG: hypothetical protein IJO16_00865 [Clostridia bacterium]|nr:hypothetical protein [Clostridia bacterium]
MKTKIEKGFRSGKLTVIEKTDLRKSGYMIWKCRCDCGNIVMVDTRKLQRGTATSCGCTSQVLPGTADLTGKRFGKLVCIEQTDERKSGRVVWRCQCDCGNEAFVSAGQLINGYTKSCGCLAHPPVKDYIGNRFGKLTVIEYAGKTKGVHRWKCRCDCGKTIIAAQNSLQSGHTRSCGCLNEITRKNNLKLVEGTSVKILEKTADRLISTNKSGHNGVYQNKRGKWVAQITFKNKTYYLGTFIHIEDAVRARKRGEELYDDFLDWYYNEYKKSENPPQDSDVAADMTN